MTEPSLLHPIPGSVGFIHDVDTAPAYWWLDILWIVLADAQATGGRFSLMEAWLPRGAGTGSHQHPWSEETSFILDSETARFLNGSTPASLEAAVIEMATPGPDPLSPDGHPTA